MAESGPECRSRPSPPAETARTTPNWVCLARNAAETPGGSPQRHRDRRVGCITYFYIRIYIHLHDLPVFAPGLCGREIGFVLRGTLPAALRVCGGGSRYGEIGFVLRGTLPAVLRGCDGGSRRGVIGFVWRGTLLVCFRGCVAGSRRRGIGFVLRRALLSGFRGRDRPGRSAPRRRGRRARRPTFSGQWLPDRLMFVMEHS